MKLFDEVNYSKNNINTKNLSKLVLIFYFFTGLVIYKDYGISWDEVFQRSGGVVNLKYIYDFLDLESFISLFTNNIPIIPEGVQSLDDWKNEEHLQRFYGISFDLPAVILEYFLFGISENEKKVYEFRHLLTFIIFFVGIYFLNAKSLKLFSSNFSSCVTILLMILSPRFFAEAFYNSKDIVFMSFLTINIYYLIKILEKPKLKYIIFISVITALAINLRVIGILFYPIALFVLLFSSYCKIIKINQFFRIFFIYFFLSVLLSVIFFPYLWSNPYENFILAVKTMSNFPVEENSKTLYFGEWISIKSLPWHYLPSWILITTPIYIIFLFFFGLIRVFKDYLKLEKKQFQIKEIFLTTNILIIIVPIIAIIISNAIVYNGWRHIYFIYPSLIIISTYGFIYIIEIFKNFKIGKFFWLLSFLIFIIYQSIWIFNTHPMQNVYFNSTVNKKWNTQFDLDYWGLGNKIVIEDLLINDKNNEIKICPISNTPLTFTYKILSEANQKRIEITCVDQPDYLIDNYYYSSGKNRFLKIKEELNIDDNYVVFNNLKNFDQNIITIYKKK